MPSSEQRKTQPSFTWAPGAGDTVSECPDCGPYWLAEFEPSSEAISGLLLREWHRAQCPVWQDTPQE